MAYHFYHLLPLKGHLVYFLRIRFFRKPQLAIFPTFPSLCPRSNYTKNTLFGMVPSIRALLIYPKAIVT